MSNKNFLFLLHCLGVTSLILLAAPKLSYGEEISSCTEKGIELQGLYEARERDGKNLKKVERWENLPSTWDVHTPPLQQVIVKGESLQGLNRAKVAVSIADQGKVVTKSQSVTVREVEGRYELVGFNFNNEVLNSKVGDSDFFQSGQSVVFTLENVKGPVCQYRIEYIHE